MVFDALAGMVEGAEGTAAESYLTGQAGLGSLIRAGQAEGLSGRAVLAAYREVGGTVTDANYWRLRQQVLGMAAPPFGEDYATFLNGGRVAELPGGREGVYQIDFRVFSQHDPSTGLPTYSVMNRSMTQRELDIDAAAQRMAELMDTLDDPGDAYGRMVGFEITSVGRYTGR